MSEWPDDWYRTPGSGSGAGGGSSADASADKTVNISANQYSAGQAGAGQHPAPPGSWPAQPPPSSPGRASYGYGGGLTAPARSPVRPGGPSGPGSPGGPRWRRWLRPKRIFGVLAVIIALVLVASIGTYFYLNSKLTRKDILVSYAGRPAPGSGTNWLIAGSDSRQGLTKKQERRFSTGALDNTGYGRSDTILVLHIPASGKPLLISFPRDSYVRIPGYGMNKINAAYSFGGPALLAKTIQNNTGLYINHFMDIGFGGFVRVVNAVGGVRMCLKHSLNDRASGLHLHTGCQVLNGGDALAYVRDRHNFATQDLQREQDQRIFLKALLSKMTSPGVILNPFAALPAASGAVSTLTVDKGTSLYQLFRVAEAMRNPQTTTVPIANSNFPTPAGDAVEWNSSQAKRLFNDLQTGQAVPKKLITGSHQGT
ncbi:MAG TPA: LCP family protein [Streptosporangiaceae bacterium]|jgi:LCP family protein required for cell wall assembly|nr:LCP family protein [Streptosporangiaceae bacterium]